MPICNKEIWYSQNYEVQSKHNVHNSKTNHMKKDAFKILEEVYLLKTIRVVQQTQVVSKAQSGRYAMGFRAHVICFQGFWDVVICQVLTAFFRLTSFFVMLVPVA